jgi:phospholipid N-methyltransferase
MATSIQSKEYDMASTDFNESQLEQFNPFRVLNVKENHDTSKAGKPYTNYVVSVSPLQNPSVKISVKMFKSSLDTIRAILTLNPKAAIQATSIRNPNTNRTSVKYTGVSAPPR